MNIGRVAEMTGISAKMIRYYEKVGLIPAPVRSGSGYRVYEQKDVYMLQFVNRARALGFSIDQMRELLQLWQNQKRASADVKALALAHVDQLNRKIKDLEAMRETLKHLADHCQGNDRPNCPIIESLSCGHSLEQ